MKNAKEFDLLADIAKLLNKYGPETFEALANLMSSPETIRSLAEVLQTTVRVSRKAHMSNGEAGAGNPVLPVRKELASVKASDPEKHALLLDFYEALQEKRALPTLRQLRDFVVDQGLPAIETTTRQKAIPSLIRFLVDLPTDELASKISDAGAMPREHNALQGWSEIILGKDRLSRPEQGQV